MADDNVRPFRPRTSRRTPEPPQPQPGDALLHRRTRAARPEARALASEQAGRDRANYTRAANRQEAERLIATGKPVPARITIALNLGGHEGPEVDVACGAVEPAVDLWEAGREIPTTEQVKLLGKLTGFHPSWFYRPMEPGPLVGPIWLCSSRGPKDQRCRLLKPDWVDERGVLHYGDDEDEAPGDKPLQGCLF